MFVEEKILLSDRKKKILNAIVSENLDHPQEVSSKELHDKYFKDVSSATIRNDLVALEEMGYLFQPHTSAGRVPTAEGFKKYITELMPERKLTKQEVEELKSKFNSKIDGVEELAQVVAESLSSLTDYASVVYVDELIRAVVEDVKVVRLYDRTALVILVTDIGVIKDITITINSGLTDIDLLSASRFITEITKGLEIGELLDKSFINNKIELLADDYRELFGTIIEALNNREQKKIVKVEGASNLLSHDEFKKPEVALQAIKMFETKECLVPLVRTGNDLEISIKVGEDENNNCSVVSADYKINGKSVGTAGVVGPIRMDYAKAVSVLKQVNSVIAEEFNKSPQSKPKGVNYGKRRKWQNRQK